MDNKKIGKFIDKFIGVILILLLFGLIINFINHLTYKELSLDEIKERLVNTKQIYVCKASNSLLSVCSKEKLVKIIEDESVVKEFIDITLSLEEAPSDMNVNKIEEPYTIYFVDSKEKVITCADFGYRYIIKTPKNEYEFNPSSNEKLRKLLKFDF